MRKFILYLVVITIIAAAGLFPFEGTDVGELHPVEVLILQYENGMLSVSTDSGLAGFGDDLQHALKDLKLTTPGEVFLDTVNYVLLAPDCINEINSLYFYLRPACQVYLFEGEGEFKEVGKYLEGHPSNLTILDCIRDEVKVPLLTIQNEVYRIAE